MQLNNKQKEAVEHFQGPLLIIAGAGTGKTRVITSRIVNLLQHHKVNSDKILALTFTEKAANEMIERIDEDMPLGYEEICIKTFHAFCDHVLRESGLEIGLDPGYKILSQVDQWFFFKKHLFDFDLEYYRPLGNPNRFIYALLSHFSKLKDELIDPDDYINYAEKLEDGEDKDKVLEVAKAYKKYGELLLKNNFLDFGDLANFTIKLFKTRTSIIKKYQERFEFILVDEFQDTNYSQFELLKLLANSHQNIVVVGDDDQSIYKWRGASLSNIVKFQELFDCKKIVLTENYRSSKSILKSSYELVQNNNPDRLEVKIGLDKKLNHNVGYDSNIQIHKFNYFTQESEFVAKKIKELSNNGVDFKDIAILVRANSHATNFIEELKFLNIPYQVRSPKGLIALEEIKDLLAVLKFLVNPRDDISLLRILKMDVFNIPMNVILELLNDPDSKCLYEAIQNEDSMLPGITDGSDTVYLILKNLIEHSKKNPVGIVLNEFLNKSGYIKYLVEKDKFNALDNINQFAKQVNRFEKSNDDKSVLDFVKYLDLLEEANAVLSEEKMADKDSVQILTVHGSKGLEFDHVFIVSAVKHRFPGIKRSEVFEVPESLTNEIYPEGDYHIQEERRLFYVAMTRAKKHLYISCSNYYEGSKLWKQSPFIDEISELNCVDTIEHPEEEDALNKLQKFKEPMKAIFDLPRFNKKRLSYSQFDTFKICPLKYNYRYLMKVPSPGGHAASFGSSIHDALYHFYKSLKSGESPTLELLKSIYEKTWLPYGYESLDHERKRKIEGWNMLKTYFESKQHNWVIPAFLERNFNLKIEDVVLSGRIDRIDKLDDGTYEIVDYKTGKTVSQNLANKDLQLSVYAMAAKNVLKIPVSKLSLLFLSTNEKISTTRNDSDIDSVNDQINTLLQQMRSSEFPATPGFHCSFCEYKLICPAA